jgi:hypothetical protein
MRSLLLALAPLVAGCVVYVECDRHEDCGSGEMCSHGDCERTTDRTWSVELVAAEVDRVHPDGLPWDTDYSPPDLYAEFGLEWDACLTSYVPDDYAPVWYETCDLYVPDDAVFLLNLWDVDGATDELATSYAWEGTAEFTELARTAGDEVGWVDSSGTIVTWMRLWPY